MVADHIDALRAGIQREVRRLVTAEEEPRDLAERDDDGLFGPDSATWVVHADLAMFIGGIRALLLQTLHPLVMAGVYDHSTYKEDPLGRLRRTAEFVGTTTFGSRDDAEAMIEQIRTLHGHVVGTAPDGRAYAATDPDLLEWVHITEVDSFLRAHQRYGVAPLGPVDCDRYVAEMAQVAQGLGVPEPPSSVAELNQRLGSYRSQLRAGAQAHDTVRFLLRPILDLRTGTAYATIAGSAIGLLPRFARRMLWLPVAPGVDPFLVRPAATALLRVLDWAIDSPPEVEIARSAARSRAAAS